MNWITDLWNRIIQSDNQPFIDKIKEKEEMTVTLRSTIRELNNELIKCHNINDNLKKEIDILDGINNSLNKELAEYAELEVKQPNWLTGTMFYKPKFLLVNKAGEKLLDYPKPQYVFDKSTYLYELMKGQGYLDIEKTYKNMYKIFKFVRSLMTYQLDKGEDWKLITHMLIGQKDDCEGFGTILTSALGMAGWKEDEVFLACGEYHEGGKEKWFGHAWCVCKVSGEWWVLEGTNPNNNPKRWKDLSKEYVANWGFCNWKFEGMISNHIIRKNGGYFLVDD